MKKILAVLLAMAMVFCMAACGKTDAKVDPNAKDEGVLSFADYSAADMDTDVVIEGFITAKAYAKDYGNVNLILQDGEGAYYVYRMPCTDADNDALKLGQKVKVSGVKTEWSGEVEIKEGTASYELAEGTYTFDALDVTSLLGKDDLIKHQNKYVAVKDAEVSSEAIYNWDGSGQEGSDLYFNIKVGGAEYTFLVESDLYGSGTDVYEAVKGLKVGDKVDLEGFLYWYNGPQTWISKVTTK